MNPTLFFLLTKRLSACYETNEARAIARLLLSDGLLWSETAVYTRTEAEISLIEQTQLEDYVHRLLNEHEPVQYVLGKAFFMGHTFAVQRGALIPRPETAELVRLILRDLQVAQRPKDDVVKKEMRILDIGTGSGCIAISLALACPIATVEAWDISPDALQIAERNAANLEAKVQFKECDALKLPVLPEEYAVIVSNPPYILPDEQVDMRIEVLEHEPHSALFVPAEDPLCFVRVLSTLGQAALISTGKLYLEINPLLAEETAAVLVADGYKDVEILQDELGRQRFAKASKGEVTQ